MRRLNNADVLRGVIAAGLCVAIQVAALCAPLVHAHLDDHDGDHHGAARVHAHVSGHHVGRYEAADPTPAVHPGDDPEEATRLQVFVAVQAAAFADPAPPPARFVLSPALESNVRRPPEVVRSHGPPERSPADSRAPPAFLFLI